MMRPRERFQPALTKRVSQFRSYWHGVCHFRTFSFFLFLPYSEKFQGSLQISPPPLKIRLLSRFPSELSLFAVEFYRQAQDSMGSPNDQFCDRRVQDWFLASQSGTAEIVDSPGSGRFPIRDSLPLLNAATLWRGHVFKRRGCMPSMRASCAASFLLFENLSRTSARLELLQAE
jgi:hypothetical protein